MSRLAPLLDSSTDELERALLMAVQRDTPGSAGLGDTALALGLSASVAKALAEGLAQSSALAQAAPLHSALTAAKVAGASSAALKGGALTASASATGLGSHATLLLVAKYVGGSALLSLLAITSIEAARNHDTSRRERTPTAAAVRAPVALQRTRRNFAPALVPSVELELEAARANEPEVSSPVVSQPANKVTARRRIEIAPRAEAPLSPSVPSEAALPPLDSAPAPDSGSSTTPAAAASASRTSLAAEIAVLDRARAALASGDAASARRLLDRYAASRPSGTLAQEAALLEVRLLLKQGDRRGAAQLAREIIRQNPESSHAASLHQLAAE